MRLIVNIQLDHLRQRLGERDIKLNLEESVIDRLALAGYDPVYGARPLKRAIQQQLENPLAQRILNGDFCSGDIICVKVGSQGLKFVKGEAAQAA